MFDLDHPEVELEPSSGALQDRRTRLPAADYRQLQEHLESCVCAIPPASELLVYVLANKVMNTRPSENLHQGDLVVGGSRVTYAIDGGDPLRGQLVHRVRKGPTSALIPVASLLGATLIGMQVGQRAPLLFGNGRIGRLAVIAVDHAT
ncbi:hypothetical protein Dshi_0556 [Dinoroseobacter shibae DFL 12 = DSM 16493]|jgi:transcription elongation GreA/GreB family factor|uniref:GreA/GreB family elongation factor n=1 Tax=Dinoroseobacter shibae (strain DSM 16493 / NCIMB 14021 / DFL 12) TaxID=398580 RepID=A8LPH9_DINSH|nr:hypothetical protein [Dinoroseobacter shibae]ABV92302.1 hypothetical protein Dshi_0556 [Dinoroseobacter shibae DFL 12 = DSM 16493]URF47252.1 hypothetical protein M8008_02845 [Dinoroseobacter shibae]URF51563.1 hypothetical protein M8007_02845 [Dinoroseobacter shibae]